jgi:hypothetical protein
MLHGYRLYFWISILTILCLPTGRVALVQNMRNQAFKLTQVVRVAPMH